MAPFSRPNSQSLFPSLGMDIDAGERTEEGEKKGIEFQVRGRKREESRKQNGRRDWLSKDWGCESKTRELGRERGWRVAVAGKGRPEALKGCSFQGQNWRECKRQDGLGRLGTHLHLAKTSGSGMGEPLVCGLLHFKVGPEQGFLLGCGPRGIIPSQ